MRRVNLLRAHGSPTAYLYETYGCRCACCRAAHTEINRRYHERNRERIADCNRRWREANRERVAESQRRWREANRERVAESQRRYNESHREQIAENHRRWREANRERVSENDRRYREANREKIAESRLRYREANREKIAESRLRYREAHRKEAAESSRRWRAEHPGRAADSNRRWHAANRERVADTSRRYREAHREEISNKNRLWYENNRQSRSYYACVHRQRETAKRYSIPGTPRHLFTLEEFKQHMESLFQPGMTWENWGKDGWHVDHKRAVATFTFTEVGDAQWLECFGLANIRPEWRRANQAKSDRVILADGTRAERCKVIKLPPDMTIERAQFLLGLEEESA